MFCIFWTLPLTTNDHVGGAVTRFILLTFTFLGWGFWEMSGGTDFSPGQELELAEVESPATPDAAETPVLRMAAIETTRADDAPAAAPISILAEAPAPAAPTPPTQAITQASFAAAAVEAEEEPVIDSVIEVAASAAPEMPARNEFAAGPIIIAGPEIIRPTEPETAALSEPLTADGYGPSLVRILGNNVNVRSGPGTGYNVVTQLLDGTQVGKVDERNGWVMIELRNGQTGWVADWLVAGL